MELLDRRVDEVKDHLLVLEVDLLPVLIEHDSGGVDDGLASLVEVFGEGSGGDEAGCQRWKAGSCEREEAPFPVDWENEAGPENDAGLAQRSVLATVVARELLLALADPPRERLDRRGLHVEGRGERPTTVDAVERGRASREILNDGEEARVDAVESERCSSVVEDAREDDDCKGPASVRSARYGVR